MNLVPIFVSENKEGIYAVHWPDETVDALSGLIDEWTDIEHLDAFFRSQQGDLNSGYYGTISIRQAVDFTRKEALELFKKIRQLAIYGQDNGQTLQEAFMPLRRGDIHDTELKREKAKGNFKRWLRIYAIRIDENTYIVSGGAIKLTETMNDRDYLIAQLKKIEKLRDYLKDQNVFDHDSYQSYCLEL